MRFTLNGKKPDSRELKLIMLMLGKMNADLQALRQSVEELKKWAQASR